MAENWFQRQNRFWNTIKYLRTKQIIWRIWYKFRPTPSVGRKPLQTAKVVSRWTEHARRPKSMVARRSFSLLNEHGDLNEIGWNGPEKSKLWRYNQHYFDDLNAANSDERLNWHKALIADWISDNPISSGNGWEPYPTSLRIVNWIKFALRTDELTEEATQSLAIQARWLSRHIEWHILGNHLMANAKALYFCGLFFDGDEAQKWHRSALLILKNELEEQILQDGAHFELSPMYHALAYEDCLDIINVARCFGQSKDIHYVLRLMSKMGVWLKTLSHPDGHIGFFNDCATNVAPTNQNLFEYAERLNLEIPSRIKTALLSDSGYFRLENASAVVLGDVARIGPDYLPSHAHADTLSFELSLFGERLIVNSGTSEYGLSNERLRQRGTLAHSTLTINDTNSSDVWSGFRVGKRAAPGPVFLHNDDPVWIMGSHDGFSRLPGKPTHTRKWKLENEFLEIEDIIDTTKPSKIDAIFRLHPDVSVEQIDKCGFRLTHASGFTAKFEHGPNIVSYTKPTTWHPEFGSKIESYLLHCTVAAMCTVTLKYKISWYLE